MNYLTEKKKKEPTVMTSEHIAMMEAIKAASPEDYQVGTYVAKEGKKSTWLMAGDGLYNIIDNNVFKSAFKMADFTIPGLPSGDKLDLFELKLPKVPYALFERLVAFYRHIHHKYKTEVGVMLYYDRTISEWSFAVPKQKVSGGLCEWETGVTSMFNDTDKIFAMESHSHHTMFGHFSGTDDADQQLPERIHLVIGHIMDDDVEFTLRVKNKDSSIELDLELVFEGEPETILKDTFDDFPDWDENVKKNTGALSIGVGEFGKPGKGKGYGSNLNGYGDYGYGDDYSYGDYGYGNERPDLGAVEDSWDTDPRNVNVTEHSIVDKWEERHKHLAKGYIDDEPEFEFEDYDKWLHL